jgi:hypothetical protein
MKKIVVVLCALCAAVLTVGCASKKADAPAPAAGPVSYLPDFVMNPPSGDDVIYGVGVAKMSNLNQSMTMAQNRARVSIAQQIDAQVRNMIDDYTAGIEGGKPADAEGFQRSVSRTLTEAKLSGTKVIQQAQGTDGTFYCLMAINKTDVKQQTEEVINAEKIKYAEFQNWNAQRDMDAAFAKPATPVVVKE